MSIPGVGRKTAEAIVSAIDDPHRFKNGRQVSAYFGFVPRQFQSGETNRYGRITKRGSALVRSILVECAWCALRYNDWARIVYDRISGDQKTRRKKAAIALARKIVVVAWALLRDESNWDMSTMVDKTEAFRRKKSSQTTDTNQPENATKIEEQGCSQTLPSTQKASKNNLNKRKKMMPTT